MAVGPGRTGTSVYTRDHQEHNELGGGLREMEVEHLVEDGMVHRGPRGKQGRWCYSREAFEDLTMGSSHP